MPFQGKKISKFVLVVLSCFVLNIASSVFAAEKPRVGVLRFTNSTHAYWWSAGTASELQDMLINELAATKAFHLLERQEIYSLLEQKFTESVSLDTKTKSKIGKTRGARYLVVATVSAFEENTSGSDNGAKFSIHFFGDEQKKAYVAIDVKVIDVETGIIADYRTITANDSASTKQTGRAVHSSVLCGNLSKMEKTPVGKAISNCISEISGYLECLLIIKDEECMKKHTAMGTKRKEKNKAVIQFGE